MPTTRTTNGTGFWGNPAMWTVAGQGTITGLYGQLTAGVFTPEATSWTAGALVGLFLQMEPSGTWYLITANTTIDATLANPPADQYYGDGMVWTVGSVPLDGDAWVIRAGDDLTFDQDQSGWTTGVNGITIQGSETSPGRLSFAATGTNYLRIKAGTNIVGTNQTLKGQLSMAAGSWGQLTDLGYATKHIIEFLGTNAGMLDLTYLDAQLKCAVPNRLSVTPYGYCLPITFDLTTDMVTLPANYELLANTAITFVGATIPGGLAAGTTYHVRDIVGQTFKVAATIGGAAINLTSTGAGVLATGQSRVTVVAATDVFTLADDAGNAGSAMTLMAAVAVGTALVNDTPIQFYTTGTLPAPLRADWLYYVVNYSAGTFKVSLNPGGPAVDITDTGTGTTRVFIGVPISHGAGAGDELPIFEDVTHSGNETWAVGAQVVLVNKGPQAYDQQRLTIAALTADTIELSVDTDSLQFPGALVWVATRNVALRSNSTSLAAPIVSGGTGATLRCEIRNVAGAGVGVTTFYGCGVSGGTSHVLGGVVSACYIGVNTGLGHTSIVSVACTYGVNNSYGCEATVRGCAIGVANGAGCILTAAGCSQGDYDGNGNRVNANGSSIGLLTCAGDTVGEVTGCNEGVWGGLVFMTSTTAMSGNTRDLRASSGTWPTVEGYGAILNSPTQFYAYKQAISIPITAVVWQLNGSVKAWCPSGTIVTDAAPPAGGPASAFKANFEQATGPVYLDLYPWGVAGTTLSVTVQMRKDFSGSQPKVELFEARDTTGPLASSLMTDNLNTWQTITMTYAVTTSRQLKLRISGQTASGNLWFKPSIAGGAVIVVED